MHDTRRTLFQHFEEDVHHRLRLQLDDARTQLDRVGKRFWLLTRFMLADRARFDPAFDAAVEKANDLHVKWAHAYIRWTLPPEPPTDLDLGS